MRGVKARQPLKVRFSDRPQTKQRKVFFGLFRFLIYGFVGLSAEVIFYTLVKVGRLIPGVALLFQFDWRVDPRLNLSAVWDAPIFTFYGQASLWMFGVYAVCAFFFIERWYRLLVHQPLALRALVYGVTILLFELVSGLLLHWITGYQIWWYADRLNLAQMTSLYILPIWCVTGLIVEVLYRELMDADLVKALESPLPPEVDPDIGLGPSA